MTIINQNSEVIYTGNSIVTDFDYTFECPTDELAVVLYDTTTFVETLLTLNVDYSVIEAFVGGTVTYPLSGIPITSLKKLIIKRDLDFTQELDLTAQGNWNPENTEDQLDRIVMMIQELATEATHFIKESPDGTAISLTAILAASANASAMATSAAASAAAASLSLSRRNRIVNGAMQVSQENVNAAGTTNNYYGADQFFTTFVSSAGTFTTQRVQSATPNGSKDRLRVTITVADAALAAGEYLAIGTRIEGQELADLQWGTAAAAQVVDRFGFKGPAGTYAVAYVNSAVSRSFIGLFTITAGQANTDTTQTIVVPGDVTGVWIKDNGIGLQRYITLACGATFQGIAGWQPGNLIGTSAVSNGMATVAAVFEVFDVGLYADPTLSGGAPRWEMPRFDDEVRRCQRYYRKSFLIDTAPVTNLGIDTGEHAFSATKAGALGNFSSVIEFPSYMCSTPAVTFYNPQAANAQMRDTTAPGDCSATTTFNRTTRGFNISATGNAGTAVGNAMRVHWSANARL